MLKCLNIYNELTKELDLVKITEKKFKNSIEDNTKMFTNCFDYFTKSQVYGNDDANTLTRLVTLHAHTPTVVKSSIRKDKKELDQAPVSLGEKSDPSKFAEDKHVIRRPTTNVEFNIPASLKLGGIADFDLQTNHGVDDYLTSKTTNKNQTESSLNNNNSNNLQNNYVNDDLNDDYQTPLEIYKSYNVNLFNI